MSDSRKASLLQSHRSPGNNWDLYEFGVAPDFFTDGVGEMILGPQITKLSWHSVLGVTQEEGADTPVERRRIIARMTIPTSVMLEVIRLVGGNIAASADQLSTASDEFKQSLQAIGAELKKAQR